MGLILSILGTTPQVFPPRAKWSLDDMPDLTGRVALVTGGNGEMGFLTSQALLAHGAKVYITTRSLDKGNTAVEKLKASTGKTDVHAIQLDLADLKSVRRAAAEFTSKETRLHILYNNAGLMDPPAGSTTAQGYEMQFGTMVLGHHVLTNLLLPIISAAAAVAPKDSVRIITTGSILHAEAPQQGIDFKSLEKGTVLKQALLVGSKQYAQAKLGDIVLSNELARRVKGNNIIVATLHPGIFDSGIWAEKKDLKAWFFRKFIMCSFNNAALTQIYVGTSTDVTAADNGGYFIPLARRGKTSHPLANDKALGRRLWDWCDEQEAKFSSA